MNPKQFAEALAAAYRQGGDAVAGVLEQAGRTLTRNTIDQVAVALRQMGDADGARQLAQTFVETQGGSVYDKALSALSSGDSLPSPGPVRSKPTISREGRPTSTPPAETGPLPAVPEGAAEETVASRLPPEADATVGDRVSGMETAGESATREATGEEAFGMLTDDQKAAIDKRFNPASPYYQGGIEAFTLDDFVRTIDNPPTSPLPKMETVPDVEPDALPTGREVPAPYSQADLGARGIDDVGPTERVLDARTTDAPGMRIDPNSEYTPYLDSRAVDMQRLRKLGLGEFTSDISVPGSSMDQAMTYGLDPRTRPLDLSGFDPMARYQPSMEPISSTQPLPVNSPSYIEPSTGLPSPAPLQGPPLPTGFDGRSFVGPPRPPYTPPPATSRFVPESGLDEFGPPLANEGQNSSRYTSNPVQGPPLPPDIRRAREPFGPSHPPKGPGRDAYQKAMTGGKKTPEAETDGGKTKPEEKTGTLMGGFGKYVLLPSATVGAGVATYNTVDSVQDFYDSVEREQASANAIDEMYREIEAQTREPTPLLNAGEPKPNLFQGQAEDMFRQRMGVEDPKQDDVLPEPPKSMKKRNLKDTI